MIGFRIIDRTHRCSLELVERFRRMPVSVVSDVMARMVASGARLRQMHDGRAMAGPALTVRTRPGDNLMVHKAIAMALPGDVIVVDAGGDLTNAIVGEIMLTEAAALGVEGVVIDGAIRDSQAVRAMSMPVFAAGVTHRGPYKDGPGEINAPIAIDGMVIHPGDLVIGDADGLLAIPCDQAEAIHSAAARKLAEEEQTLTAIRSGVRRDKSWIDTALAAAGCQILG